MEKFDNELLEKAKQAKSAEELLELAKANNVEMTADEAKAYYAQLHPTSGEMSDDELDNVAGGGCGQKTEHFDFGDTVMCLHDTCPKCGSNIGIYQDIAQGNKAVWRVVCSDCGDAEIIAFTFAAEDGRIKKV